MCADFFSVYAGVDEVFTTYDPDGTGFMSGSQLRNALHDLNPDFQVSDEIVAANLAHLNTGVDGKLSKDEFSALADDWVTDVISLPEAFNFFNIDGNGNLNINELPGASFSYENIAKKLFLMILAKQFLHQQALSQTETSGK